MRRPVRDEGGFTFPELTIAMAIALVVAAGGMVLVSMATRTQLRTSDRASDLQLGRALIERFTRDLRQGQGIAAPTPSGLQVLTYVDGSSCSGTGSGSTFCRVSYSCSSTSCTRSIANPDGSSATAPEKVADGIMGPNVFTYAPNLVDPNYVTVRLAYAGEGGEESVTLSDGAGLRNHLATGTDP
jgi:prepilin-type N-terminal cleavage/methylation domain-containing protein